MKHSASRTLFDHWLSLRRGRPVPDRNDLDPVAIRGLLSHTFMLEVDAKPPSTRDYPVRVSGTRLDALFGRSVRDSAFAVLWQPRHRAEMLTVAEAVLDEGWPAVVGATAAPAGYAPIALEMLMLPLRCLGESRARLFCSLVPLKPPTWLGLGAVDPLDLVTWRLIEPGPDASTASDGMPDRRTLVTARTALRPRLMVIAGGKSYDASDAESGVQCRIKAAVPGSTNAPLSTRSS